MANLFLRNDQKRVPNFAASTTSLPLLVTRSKACKATSEVASNGTDPSTVNSGATLERNGTQATPPANAMNGIG
jgi:hypothetical protein